MRIKILLEPIDKEDPLAIDPVGTITLESGEDVLSEPYVYLDSWLKALEKGSAQMSTTYKADIDLIEERDPLTFERIDGCIRISYKDKSVIVNNTEEIRIAVADAFKELAKTQIFPKRQ